MLSFQNKTNDKYTDKFLNDLKYLHNLIQTNYKDYNVIHL